MYEGCLERGEDDTTCERAAEEAYGDCLEECDEREEDAEDEDCSEREFESLHTSYRELEEELETLLRACGDGDEREDDDRDEDEWEDKEWDDDERDEDEREDDERDDDERDEDEREDDEREDEDEATCEEARRRMR